MVYRTTLELNIRKKRKECKVVRYRGDEKEVRTERVNLKIDR